MRFGNCVGRAFARSASAARSFAVAAGAWARSFSPRGVAAQREVRVADVGQQRVVTAQGDVGLHVGAEGILVARFRAVQPDDGHVPAAGEEIVVLVVRGEERLIGPDRVQVARMQAEEDDLLGVGLRRDERLSLAAAELQDRLAGRQEIFLGRVIEEGKIERHFVRAGDRLQEVVARRLPDRRHRPGRADQSLEKGGHRRFLDDLFLHRLSPSTQRDVNSRFPQPFSRFRGCHFLFVSRFTAPAAARR